MHPVLENERLALCNIPLEEGPGEEYHRRTHLTLMRGSHSREPWILGSTRTAQNLDRCTSFVNKGPEAATAFRFEWLRYKRILRPFNNHQRFTPLKPRDKEFFSRLYRLRPDEDDWGSLVAAPKSEKRSDDSDGMDSSKYEWLRSAIVAGGHYSVPLDRTEVDEDGNEREINGACYFQILSTMSGSNRPKLMPTVVVDLHDEALAAPLAVNLQYMDVWQKDSEQALTVYFDSEPVVYNILDVADWATLRNQLFSWDAGLSAIAGCVDIKSPRLAGPQCSVMDRECPVLMVVEQLKLQKWVPCASKFVHTTLEKHFDSRNPSPVRKYYYQVLLSLEDRLKVNPKVDSEQPGSYYQLVLRDVVVSANQGDKHYRNMLGDLGGDGGDVALVAAVGRPEASEFDVADAVADAAGVPVVAPQERKPRAVKVALPPLALPEEHADSDDGDSSSSNSSSSSSSSSSRADSDGSFDVAKGRSAMSVWVDVGDGVPPFKLDKYKPRGKAAYVRLIARCLHHDNCFKRRSTAKTSSLGDPNPAY